MLDRESFDEAMNRNGRILMMVVAVFVIVALIIFLP